MKHEYNTIVAGHYSAYRPALHGVILSRLIEPNEHFINGIDVGCGTGYSTIALAKYCDKVIGLDPNDMMLSQATIHPKISYFQGDGDSFSDLRHNHFDIVTFAGSLSYTKTGKLKSELILSMNPAGIVLVYDFQIFLDKCMNSLDVGYSVQKFDYNFEENLSDWSEFSTEIASTDNIELHLSLDEIAHILLANSYRLQLFQSKFSSTDPFDDLVTYIRPKNITPKLDAKIYFARHRVL